MILCSAGQYVLTICPLIILPFTSVLLITSGDVKHHSFVADVSKSADVDELFKKLESTFAEAPTVVVNVAGICEYVPFLQMTEQQFDSMIETNMKVWCIYMYTYTCTCVTRHGVHIILYIHLYKYLL